MKQSKRLLPLLITAALCALGLCLVFLFPAVRFAGYVLLGIACFMVCCGLVRLLGKKAPAIAHILGCILSVFICFFLPASIVIGCLILRAGAGSEDADCDYLIVLGAGVRGTVPSRTLQYRLDTAYDHLISHPDTVAILSGGKGSRKNISEAECMFRYLTRRGIPAARLLSEGKATSTQENLIFSREMIPDPKTVTIGILSSEYHLFRARMMARDQGLEPIMIPACTKMLPLRINYYLREIAGVWYYLIFGG